MFMRRCLSLAAVCGVFFGAVAFAAVSVSGIETERSRQVRAFLHDGCPVAGDPCWAGITPGVTTLDEGLALLRAHPWITHVEVTEQALRTLVMWDWNGHQPFFLGNGSSPAQACLLVLHMDGLVAYIAILTSLPYADVRFELGVASSGYFSLTHDGGQANIYHIASYLEERLLFHSRIVCPFYLRGLYEASVVLAIHSSNDNAGISQEPYRPYQWLRRAVC